MYQQTLYPETKQVLEKLKAVSLISNFYLAGGTGLALQLGHRKSVDLDFFIKIFPKRDLLLQRISHLNPKVMQEEKGTLDMTIDNVKVSFLQYQYPLLEELVEFEAIKIASITDIGCMKLSAISSRGTKKDFVDLYFILQKYSLSELIDKFNEKYKGVHFQKLHILKSITYFSDAENDPNPDYTQEIAWGDVKIKLEKETKRYLSSLNF